MAMRIPISLKFALTKDQFYFTECQGGQFLEKYGSYSDSKKTSWQISVHLMIVKKFAAQFWGMCTNFDESEF